MLSTRHRWRHLGLQHIHMETLITTLEHLQICPFLYLVIILIFLVNFVKHFMLCCFTHEDINIIISTSSRNNTCDKQQFR